MNWIWTLVVGLAVTACALCYWSLHASSPAAVDVVESVVASDQRENSQPVSGIPASRQAVAGPSRTEESAAQHDAHQQVNGTAPAASTSSESIGETAFRDGDEVGVVVSEDFVQVINRSGDLVGEGGWVNGRKSGYWQYFEDGVVTLAGSYVDGVAEGTWEQFAEDGTLLVRASTRNGLLDGSCYFAVGSTRQSGLYKAGKLIVAKEEGLLESGED